MIEQVPWEFLLPSGLEAEAAVEMEFVEVSEERSEEEFLFFEDTHVDTSSHKQPKVPGPVFTISEYKGVKGKGISFETNMRDEAAYYEENRKKKMGYGESDWSSTSGNEYVPREIHNASDAIDAVNQFIMPKEIRSQALRASRHLVNALDKVATLKVIEDQPTGRINRRRIADLVRASDAGTYNPDEIRPFRKVISTPAKVPVIAIVADASNAKMWSDAAYIPKILKITLGVLWACESVGLQTYAALCEEYYRIDTDKSGYQEGIWAHILAEPFKALPMKYYASLLHRDLWRFAGITIEGADQKAHEKFKTLGYGWGNYGTNWPSLDGGNAVNWARQRYQADIVIAIGDVKDKKQADIQLDAKFTVEQAVQQIVKQAKSIRRD